MIEKSLMSRLIAAHLGQQRGNRMDLALPELLRKAPLSHFGAFMMRIARKG
jgi:hypothetical protein